VIGGRIGILPEQKVDVRLRLFVPLEVQKVDGRKMMIARLLWLRLEEKIHVPPHLRKPLGLGVSPGEMPVGSGIVGFHREAPRRHLNQSAPMSGLMQLIQPPGGRFSVVFVHSRLIGG